MLLRTLPTNAATGTLRFSNSEMSFDALLDTSLRIAAGLARLGVQPGDTVAVSFPNGPGFLVALCGVVEAGAIALPLNPAYERAEIALLADRARAKAFLCADQEAAKIRDVASTLGAPLVVTESATGAGPTLDALRATTGAPPPPPPAEQVAVYFHSSGSTGRPKLIPRTFAQLTVEAASFGTTANVTADDVILCQIPLFHSHAFGNCLLAWLRARCTLVVPDGRMSLYLRVNEILTSLQSHGVTILPAVPFLYDLLSGAKAQPDLSRLRLPISAGVPLPRAVFDRFLERFGIGIRQLYGCSESGAVTLNLSEDPVASAHTVGAPLDGARIAIDHDDGGDGTGDVVVQTEALATCYLGPDGPDHAPFAGGRFRPGDLGSIDAEGRLCLTGRRRLFIDVAGNKVDPFEIEDVLLEHPEVQEAAVVGVPASRGFGESIKAVIVTTAPVDPAEIERFCGARLAPYKVPRWVERVDALPKSPLGKVLRKYLT